MTRTVLIIEDDADIRSLLGERLARAGYAVREADSGEAGLRSAAEERPDLVVVDIRLPGIDGWQVIERLGADASLATVPVLVASITDPSEATPPSVKMHLVKPISRGTLELAVQELLGE
jgi:DNA-binding response OmpR family regulator